MSRLDSMLRTGERVVWRHDPELSMGPKWPYVTGIAVLLAMLTVLGSVVLWNVEVPPRIALLAGLLFSMPVLFCTGPLLSGMWSRAIAVTAGRVAWRSGPGGLGTAATIERADIAAATIYEGSAALILHSQDGRVIRLSGIAEAEPLARALAVPTRIWRKGGDVQNAPEALWPRFVGVLLSVAPTELLGRGVIFGDWTVFDEYGIFMFLLIGLLIGGTTIFHVWAEIAAARKLSPADREKKACRRLNSLCRGEEPTRPGVVTVLALPFQLFDRWLIRKAYGGPYNCDCPPETFGPGTGRHI